MELHTRCPGLKSRATSSGLTQAPQAYNSIFISMSDGEDNAGAGAREQDRFLPIANIARIMKKTLPANAKIAKDAKEVNMWVESSYCAMQQGRTRKDPLPRKRADLPLTPSLRVTRRLVQTVQECVSEFISFITSEWVGMACMIGGVLHGWHVSVHIRMHG